MNGLLKKVLSVLTVSAMVLSLASCSSSSSSSESDTQTASSSDPVTLDWYLYVDKTQSGLDAVQEALNQYLVDKINVKVNIHEMDCGTYGTKMPIIINSGENYDICQTATWGIVNYVNTALTGAFWDLSENSLQADAPETYKTIPEKLWTSAKVNGKIYGVPTYKEEGVQYDVMVNDDLAKQYDIDYSNLTTWEDLGPILKDAKSKLPSTVTPMDSAYLWSVAKSYAVSAGSEPGYVPVHGDDSPYNDIDSNTVFNIYDTDYFQTYCDTVYSWYKAGYFPTNIQTYSDDNRSSDDKANKLFAWIICYAPGYDTSYSASVGHNEVAVPITKCLYSGASDLQSISANSENKDAALKFLNLVNTDLTVGNYLRHGVEGTNYTLDDNDKVHALNTDVYGTDSGWQFGNIFNQTWTDGTASDIVDQYDAYNDNTVENPILGYVFDDANVKNQISAISSIQSQYYDPLINGYGDPSTLVAQYRDQLKANGSEALLAEQQKQVTAFLQDNS